MIRVNFEGLTLIYLALMLGPIAIAWLINEYRRSRRERAAFKSVIRCRICAFEFKDRSAAIFPPCPRCGSANERASFVRL